MELKPILKTAPAVRQQLVLSPRLYQSLRILRLGAPELQELIQKEIEENPTLEIPEPSEPESGSAPSPERELWEDYLAANRSVQGAGRTGSDAAAAAGELAASPVTLADHLTLQLELENPPGRQHRIGLAIIGSLDEDGYLREPLAELASTINRPPARSNRCCRWCNASTRPEWRPATSKNAWPSSWSRWEPARRQSG